MIESDFLFDEVFDFILNEQNIQDATRKSILMRVKGSMKRSKEQNSRSSILGGSPTLRKCANTISSANDDSLRKINLWVKGERIEGGRGNLIKISQEEVKSVISDKFKFMARDDQNFFAMYLSSNKQIALNHMDQLLLLHNIYPSPLFIRLVLDLCIDLDGQYQRLYKIPWNLVSFETISSMVTQSTILEELLEFDCKNEYKRRRDFNSKLYSKYSERFEGCGQIELIMLWALANRTNVNHIRQLLTEVCFRKTPSEYLKRVVLPCLKIIFPDMNELNCAHTHKENEVFPSLMSVRVERMPNKTYQLRSYGHTLAGDKSCLFYELRFAPSEKNRCLTLKSHDIERGQIGEDFLDNVSKSHSFILYDESTPHLPFYPLFIRSSDLPTIKSIVQSSANFRCMFYQRFD